MDGSDTFASNLAWCRDGSSSKVAMPGKDSARSRASCEEIEHD